MRDGVNRAQRLRRGFPGPSGLPRRRAAQITPPTLSDTDPGQDEQSWGQWLRAVRAAAFAGPQRRWTWGGIVAAALVLVAGGGLAVYVLADPGRRQLLIQTGPRFPYSTPAERTPDRLRVLFLGNSFTQFNGGQALILRELARSAGKRPPPVFDQVTKFGATWAELWSQSASLDTIRQGGWDYVVLQDYSRAAMIYRTEMDQYGNKFATEVRKAGARPLFFMTWARKDEPKTQQQIAGAYTRVAEANHAAVVPVGTAWEAALAGRKGLVLHTADTKHPTPAGSYLSACVFYAVLYHQSPHGLTPVIRDDKTVYITLPVAEATYLQDVAWRTVQQAGRLSATRPTSRPATTQATTTRPVQAGV